jgi:predicted 3-demethylubiquinone-9 3-methyltransferase (glyoxalase superfamily)
MQKITPFFWFEKNMSEILGYYEDIFYDFKIISRNKMSETPSGDVEIVEVEIFGNRMSWMTAGPYFKFNEAISFVISTDGQEETDYYWQKLTAGGGTESQCGWCKDKYGVSWQVVPKQLGEAMSQTDSDLAKYASAKMLQMKKIIIKDLYK